MDVNRLFREYLFRATRYHFLKRKNSFPGSSSQRNNRRELRKTILNS